MAHDDWVQSRCHVCGFTAWTYCDECGRPICDECWDESDTGDFVCNACWRDEGE